MPKPVDTPDDARRNFLKLASVAAPAAIAAAGLPAAEAEAATPAESGTLRDTAHIRAYYATARF